jgi:hypothetical protein
MSRFGRIVGALLATAALAVWPATPAQAAQGGVYVQVNPNTIQAGFQVGINASCGEDLNPATVTSRAFGEITLNPYPGSRLLSGSATVPSDTEAGEYRVDLECANGATASAELFVLGMAMPTRGPSTGGGGTAAAGPTDPDRLVPALLGGASAVALAAGLGLLLVRRRTT